MDSWKWAYVLWILFCNIFSLNRLGINLHDNIYFLIKIKWHKTCSHIVSYQGMYFNLIFNVIVYLTSVLFLEIQDFTVSVSNLAAAAKSLQSCPTLCDPRDGSPPGSPVPGILQTRTLEWVAIYFSNAWKWKVKVKLLSHVWLLVTSWTVAHQAPPSMEFSRQEYWSGVPLPSPSNLKSWAELKSLSCVRLFATPWTVAPQAPRSMGFSGHEYWSGLPFPSPGDLPDQGIEPGSPAL